MFKHTIRYGGVATALTAALAFATVPTAIASDSHGGEAYVESGASGGGLDLVAFERIGDAGVAQECDYWDEGCNNVAQPIAAVEPDPYDPGGELDAMAASEGGLVPVAFERGMNVDIGGIGLGLKGEPAGHSIGHDGSLEGELIN